MKRILLLVIAFALFNTTDLFAQGCPTIINSSFRLNTDPVNPCHRTVSFDFINPTNGNKGINVTIKVDGIEVMNICLDASGHKDEVRNFITPQFTACSVSNIDVAITPKSNASCSGASCAATIRSIGGAPLPVIFSSFTATKNSNSTVLLKWETVTEINNRGFTIERNNSGNWEQVGFTASQSADGNSSSVLQYQFTDINNNKNITQYRIRQTDFDGKNKYTEIRTVRGEQTAAKTIVFPNPSNDGKLTVLFADASPRNISLLDMTGRTLKQWNAYQQNSLQVTSLTSGMFTIRYQDLQTGTVYTEKLLINAR